MRWVVEEPTLSGPCRKRSVDGMGDHLSPILHGVRSLPQPYTSHFEMPRAWKVFFLAGAVWCVGLFISPAIQKATYVATRLVSRPLVARVLLEGPRSRGGVMAVMAGADGTMWSVALHAVHRYPKGIVGAAERVMTPKQATELLGPKASSFAEAALDDEGLLWIVSWRGEVLRQTAGGGWRVVARRGDGPSGRVDDLLAFDGRALVAAGNGLWEVRAEEGVARALHGFENVSCQAVARLANGDVLAGTGRTVRIEVDGAWSDFWQAPREAKEVTALGQRSDGTILVGCRLGFYEVSPAGETLERHLPESWVKAFAETEDGRLWVGTWQEGLKYLRGGVWETLGPWQGFPGESVSDLALDDRGRLWIALYGGGTCVLDLPTFSWFEGL